MLGLSEDQLIVIDAILHAMALGVAVWYGFKNHHLVAVALACLSPIVFILLAESGPGEFIDGFPTWPTLVRAYVAANALLVGGLALVGLPQDGQASDEEAGPRWRRLLAGIFSGYVVLVSLWAAVDVLLKT